VVLFFYPADFSFICPTEVKGFHTEGMPSLVEIDEAALPMVR
jgi:alkyl hydroperoxide reductase subunit AhpC